MSRFLLGVISGVLAGLVVTLLAPGLPWFDRVLAALGLVLFADLRAHLMESSK